MAKLKQIHEYPSQLEIFEGLMGSGKSYYAVRRLIDTLKEQARPVYTNLPLKHQVLRKYLRDLRGEAMANLVHELTEDHWRRFLRRQDQFATFKTKCDSTRPCDLSPQDIADIHQACVDSYPEHPPTLKQIQTSERFYINWIISWFDSIHGQPIYTGPDANHIPPASIIIIDEIQRWHPMMNQSKDPDRNALLSYITMSRHHAHWIWVLTQDAMNISIEFRRLAHFIWMIWNRAEDEIVGALKFKHLKFGTFQLRAMAYARYTHDDYELNKTSTSLNKRANSVETFTVFTNLPYSKMIYRFYSSETHLGSKRQLQKKLRQGQIEAGVDPDNPYQEPTEEMEDNFLSRIILKLYKFITLIIIVIVAFFIGRQFTNEENQPTQQIEQQYQWPKWTMLSSTPWIDGRPRSKGDTVASNGAILEFIAPDNRSLVLLHDNIYWLWNFGSEPIKVGSREDVAAAVAALRASESDDIGTTISTP